MRRRLPISLRLGLWIAVVLATVLGLLGGSIYGVLSAQLRQASFSRAESAVLQTLQFVGGTGLGGEHVGLGDQGALIAGRRGIVEVQITDAAGRVVQRSEPTALPLPSSLTSRTTREIAWRGTLAAYESAPIRDGKTVIGTVQVAASEAHDLRTLALLRRLMLDGGAASLALVVVLGFVVSWRALRPIREITRVAVNLSQTGLHERLQVHGLDEVGSLAQAFNGMLNRLEASFARQRRFVSDASHELRTPLAVIAGYVDLLSRWDSFDDAVRREAVETVGQETRRMQRLVQDLLFLARGQQGFQVRRRYFDLCDLVGETVRACQALPGGDRVTDVSEGIAPVQADWDLVRQLLWIFIDNAMKFTPPDRAIRVAARMDDGQPCLVVVDEGIGMTEEVQGKLFQRFYRADPARTSGQGTGLGLAIAQEIVEIHSASIDVQSVPGQGTTIMVRFPPASDL